MNFDVFSMIYLVNVRFHGVMAMHRMQGLIASVLENILWRQSRKCFGSVFHGENRPFHDVLCSEIDWGDSQASVLVQRSTERFDPSMMFCARKQIGETVTKVCLHSVPRRECPPVWCSVLTWPDSGSYEMWHSGPHYYYNWVSKRQS